MTTATLNWLSKKVPRFTELDEEEQEQFSDFLLLWSLFEGTELGTYGSPPKIRQYVSELGRNGKLQDVEVST